MRNVVSEIETDICSLSGVVSAHVVLSPDELEIDEVHVVATFDRSPKQIVRDIESLVLSNHNIRVDHKKISIAQLKDAAAAIEQALQKPSDKEKGPLARIRFVSARSNTYGLRWEVTVELEKGGIPSSATANGAASRRNKTRLVAQATTEALNNFLGDMQAVAVEDVHTLDAGGYKAVVVMISMLSDRTEKILAGSSLLEDDMPKSVVHATLDAINRAI
jgi:hypothetical protein